MKTKFLFFALMISLSSYGQQFINGSFEQNTVANDTSIYCPDLSKVMNDSYGLLGWVTVSNDTICQDSITTASDGKEYLSYFGIGKHDSTKQTPDFNLGLTTNLTAGNVYNISFDAHSPSTKWGMIEIGVTNDTAVLGSKLDYVLIDTSSCWKTYSVAITPQVNANYISVRVVSSDPNNNPTIMGNLDNFSITNSTGLETEKTVNDIRMFPNPAENSFTVVSANTGKFLISDMHGRTVKTASFNTQVDMSEEPAGMYFIRSLNSEKPFVEKLILSH